MRRSRSRSCSLRCLVAGALLAFGFYIRTLSERTDRHADAAPGRAARNVASRTRDAGGDFAASLLLGTGSEIVFLDANTRVTVYRAASHRSATRSSTCAAAAIFRAIRARIGPARAGHSRAGDRVRPAAAATRTSATSTSSCAATTPRSSRRSGPSSFRCSSRWRSRSRADFSIARALTRQALRPLDDVTAALQRFASGDLTPQPIAADERHELGTLAAAYNGAIDQMERAFAARDRANASMRQFIADAGHQLRTPLTVVQGFIAILRRGGFESPADRDRILDTMNDQSRIMGSLIDKLILLERWESPEAHARVRSRSTSERSSPIWSRRSPTRIPTAASPSRRAPESSPQSIRPSSATS